MTPICKLPLIDRCKAIIGGFLRAVGTRSRPHVDTGPAVAIPLIDLVGTRMNTLQRRLTVLLWRIEAGTLRKLPDLPATQADRPEPETTAPGATNSAAVQPAETESGTIKPGTINSGTAGAASAGSTTPGTPEQKASPRKPRPSPKDFGIEESWGWAARIAGQAGSLYRVELQAMLADPVFQALIAAHPRRFGRLLRPLCHMLGIPELPDLLRLPSQSHIEIVDPEAATKPLANSPARAKPRRAARHQPPFRFYVTPFGRLQPQLE